MSLCRRLHSPGTQSLGLLGVMNSLDSNRVALGAWVRRRAGRSRRAFPTSGLPKWCIHIRFTNTRAVKRVVLRHDLAGEVEPAAPGAREWFADRVRIFTNCRGTGSPGRPGLPRSKTRGS